MPVTPYCPNLLQDHKELYQLLCSSKQQSLEKDCSQIVSISQEVQPLDPLAVLQAIAKPDQLQFYLEKRDKAEAIAAIDTAISINLKGPDRFPKARRFIQACLDNTISVGSLNLPFSGPHFFCSFTFFNNQPTANSPFPSATIFLPRWQISCRQTSYVLVTNVEIEPQINLELLVEELGSQFIKISRLSHSLSTIFKTNPHRILKYHAKKEERFKSSVSSVLKSIQANQLHKVVLASAIDVVASRPFNLVNCLQNLRKRYPECYVFSTSNGKGQNFVGASPERLLSICDRKLLTEALAGSAPRGKTSAEDIDLANRLLSSEKERREHQFVLNFIAERLSELGLIPQLLPTPQLLKLSNIQHLWTPIQTQLLTDIHPLEIVARLHPTPAVAGVPTQIAQEQILGLETFERSLYAAPLGWVDYHGNCEFIVGIRSALIESEKPSQARRNTYRARLYAGAGIVAGSNPDKELAEIQLKLQALLKALL